MKKAVAVLLLLLSAGLSLSSCMHIKKYDSCHPVNHPMSKWEGYAEGVQFELYIGDDEYKDFMVIDYGNKKISYLVRWHRNYASQISITDVRESFVDENKSPVKQTLNLPRGSWDIELIDEIHFKFVRGSVKVPDATCDIPEVTLPSEIVMVRIPSEISSENFPQIEKDEAYDRCPTYRYGTQWISDDNKVIIDNIKSSGTYTAGTSKVTFVEEPNLVYLIGFFELDYKVYLTKWEQDSLFYFSKSEFLKSTEEWQCEYFENYFTARVVRSEHYDPGHILTFTLLETPLDSKE